MVSGENIGVKTKTEAKKIKKQLKRRYRHVNVLPIEKLSKEDRVTYHGNPKYVVLAWQRY